MTKHIATQEPEFRFKTTELDNERVCQTIKRYQIEKKIENKSKYYQLKQEADDRIKSENRLLSEQK